MDFTERPPEGSNGNPPAFLPENHAKELAGCRPWASQGKSLIGLKATEHARYSLMDRQTHRPTDTTGNNSSTIVHGKCVKVSTYSGTAHHRKGLSLFSTAYLHQESLASSETQRGQAIAQDTGSRSEPGPHRRSLTLSLVRTPARALSEVGTSSSTSLPYSPTPFTGKWKCLNFYFF